jgi:acetyl-CoA carboxylase biotin carboxylase subunit
MIAKLITYGADREEAIQRMRRALDECVIEGVPSTLAFHARIMQNPRYLSGDFSTHFIEEEDWRSAGR